MHHLFTHRRTLRYMRWLIGVSLILLSVGAVIIGIRMMPSNFIYSAFITPTPPPERRIVARINESYLDQDGNLVQTDRTYAVPEIDVQLPAFYGGEKVYGEGIQTIIALLEEFQHRQLAVDTVRIYNDQYMELYLSAGITVIVNSSADSYDIGSSKTVTIIVSIDDEDQLSVIGVAHAESRGVRKGNIVDIEEATSTVVSSLEAAERMAGYQVESAFVSVGGTHISSQNTHGVVAVADPSAEITESDVER